MKPALLAVGLLFWTAPRTNAADVRIRPAAAKRWHANLLEGLGAAFFLLGVAVSVRSYVSRKSGPGK